MGLPQTGGRSPPTEGSVPVQRQPLEEVAAFPGQAAVSRRGGSLPRTGGSLPRQSPLEVFVETSRNARRMTSSSEPPGWSCKTRCTALRASRDA